MSTKHDSYLVENWDTETFINFLKEQNLKLDDDDFRILQVQALKEKLKRAFFLYKSLKEVLTKYGIDGKWYRHHSSISADDDKELVQCIKEVKRRLRNMGTMLADSNEAMHCKYISAILHASLYIIKRITDKELTLAPQLEIVGEESTGRSTTQSKPGTSLHHGREATSSGYGFRSESRSLQQPWNESALKEGSEKEKDLHKNVKRVMEVIVGLLKNRLECVDEEPDRKKARVEGYHSKK
ncbi:hypothetical protein RhiirA4_469002 [Rhizophagus irregularis]|uniref:Uncharacterized protein n=1 Tax=Rhizophagus irregularis TaxID=588596 RepID=A0A2I1GYQ5_9GLOM|nr:hypothetical protein RhiirA4_469002 [Rhizophagus irregularis]